MLGIVILNYNNIQDIKSCVGSILNNTDSNAFRMVVVDNGSDICIRDSVQDALAEYSKQSFAVFDAIPANETVLPLVSYLKLPENVGYSRGNNAGLDLLRMCDGIEEVMFCNSDILFTSDIVTPLLKELQDDNEIGALSPILYKPDGTIDLSCARLAYVQSDLIFTFSWLFSSLYKKRIRRKQLLLSHPEVIRNNKIEIDMPSGSCMLFKMSVLNQIDGFDPNTFLYYEEAILYEKLRSIGKRNYVMPSLSCIHTGGVTTGSTKPSYFLKKCNIDSLLYYMTKYMDASSVALLYIRFTGALSLCLLKILITMKRILSCVR